MNRRFSRFLIAILPLAFFTTGFAQDQTFYEMKEKDGKTKQTFTMDFSKLKKPKSPKDFTKYFHLPPVRQDTTGTCWCFSTISFLESELVRMGKQAVKLSEMYIVYWEYVEKVRRFVHEKGDSFIGEGSEHNAVLERMKQYGLVRQTDYSGFLNGKNYHQHSKLFKEIKSYLDYISDNQIWDENQAIANTKLILNKYLGQPPESIMVEGKEITPTQYMKDYLQLNPNTYVCLMSMMYAPFYEMAEFKVADNWWRSEDYYNVPIDDFYQAVVDALKNGFTVAIGGDTSEIGRNGEQDVAIIPSFDIPSKYIDQSAREFRYHNKTSSDDHAMHLVGSKKMADHTWFLIKDSGSGAWKGQFKGYFMFRDDYIKLKMLNIMVHRDAIPELMKKLKVK